VKRIITYKTKPTGGLGNRLFQYNFIIQASYLLGFDYLIYPTSDYRNLSFKLSNNKSIILKKLMTTSFKMPKVTNEESTASILEDIKKISKSYGHVRIPPGLLGEHFFDISLLHPKSIFHIRRNRKVCEGYIALHFRGLDMIQHDPDAILDLDYYINGVELASKNTELPIVLVTDDKNLVNYNILKSYYKNRLINYESIDFFDDFCVLKNSDYLISSPSTFSIWAGILGEQKNIFHSKSFVLKKLRIKDKFWVDLYFHKNNNLYNCEFL
jgi:hypothetical protein